MKSRLLNKSHPVVDGSVTGLMTGAAAGYLLGEFGEYQIITVLIAVVAYMSIALFVSFTRV